MLRRRKRLRILGQCTLGTRSTWNGLHVKAKQGEGCRDALRDEFMGRITGDQVGEVVDRWDPASEDSELEEQDKEVFYRRFVLANQVNEAEPEQEKGCLCCC